MAILEYGGVPVLTDTYIAHLYHNGDVLSKFVGSLTQATEFIESYADFNNAYLEHFAALGVEQKFHIRARMTSNMVAVAYLRNANAQELISWREDVLRGLDQLT
jgi:hypothetical protein